MRFSLPGNIDCSHGKFPSSQDAKYDVVVAGAGHNSLITAAYLAKAGLRVLVLESRPVIGGNTTSEELTLPGYLHDSCSSAHVLIQSSPTIKNNELHLDRYGLSYIKPEIVATMPFSDGHSFTMYWDKEKTVKEISRYSQKDALEYQKFLDDWSKVSNVYLSERYGPPRKESEILKLYEELENGDEWVRIRLSSSKEVIEERFEEEHVRAFLCWMASQTVQPITRKNTGFLAFSILAGRQNNSWTLPRGGSISLPLALQRFIEERGGKIVTSAHVSKVLIEKGRAVGFETIDGRRFYARKVCVSSMHVKDLIKAIDQTLIPEDFAESVKNWKVGITLFVTHYALSEAPRYRSEDGSVMAGIGGAAESVDNLVMNFQLAEQGKLNWKTPCLLLVCPSVADSSRAPLGKHTYKIIAFVTGNLREGKWDDIKEEYSKAIFEYVSSLTTNIKSNTVLGKLVESPLDLWKRNPANWGGSCHGGDMTSEQNGLFRPSPKWSNYRMFVEGLYQTGDCTHPGGSVSGAPGRNAAKVILEDLAIDFDKVASA
jgi:phytoene dehydrogenase-like protein